MRRALAPAIVLLGVALAVVAAKAPLVVYALSLALFGLPHVATELRYVDRRFAWRFSRGECALIAIVLLGVVAVRCTLLCGILSPWLARPLELAGVVTLAGIGLRRARNGGLRSAAVATAVLLSLVLGALHAPAATLVVLAFLHNLTPLGFLAERLDAASRRRALPFLVLLFGILPLLVAGGIPRGLFDGLLADPMAGSAFFAIGPLDDHLGVFVPGAWFDAARARDLFAAAAYLQVLHYATVLCVLPRLALRDATEGLVRWPAGVPFAAIVLGSGLVMTAAFLDSFVVARGVYGVAAAVHAWLEVPVLMAALGPRASAPVAGATPRTTGPIPAGQPLPGPIVTA